MNFYIFITIKRAGMVILSGRSRLKLPSYLFIYFLYYCNYYFGEGMWEGYGTTANECAIVGMQCCVCLGVLGNKCFFPFYNTLSHFFNFYLWNYTSLKYFLSFVQAQRVVPSVTCLPTASFRQVVRQMVENRVHRMFITDQADRPVGIISMGDILQLLSV